jgi:hypothetical protein
MWNWSLEKQTASQKYRRRRRKKTIFFFSLFDIDYNVLMYNGQRSSTKRVSFVVKQLSLTH